MAAPPQALTNSHVSYTMFVGGQGPIWETAKPEGAGVLHQNARTP